MKYIYWDIDGTLLLSGMAGADALLDAIEKRFGVKDFQFSHPLAGSTDSQIVKQVCLDIKGSCRTYDAANLLIDYHRLLPEYLKTHHGRLMPNVKETLAYFAQRADFKTCLLTGNTATGAYLKLQRYGLDGYFDSQYATCGELSEDRSELARIALRRLRLLHPEATADDMIFIGDTPNDIRCAKAIGARCVAVLAGSTYSRGELAQHSPWRLLDKLPNDPAELAQLFTEA